MKSALAFIVLFAASTTMLAQQSFNNDAVIKLVKAGLSDDLIISTIGAQPGNYDTTPDGLIALKTSGASDKVVAAIVAKSNAPITPSVDKPKASDAKSDASTTPEAKGSEPATPESSEPGTAIGSKPIHLGSRLVIAPMGGFETYFAAAVRSKKVPIVLTLDKNTAEFFVVSTNTEWQGFVYGSGGTASRSTAAFGASASSTRGVEASIMLIDAHTKDVVWAYEVHKSSHGSILFGTAALRGQQSVAEACAKHLKEYIEKGK